MDSISSTTATVQSSTAISSNDSAWKTDSVQNAVATLNDGSASVSDQLDAFNLIQNLILDPKSGAGAARNAVIGNKGFNDFINKINNAQFKLNTNGNLSKAAANFDNMSPDEQKLATWGSNLSTNDYSDNLKLRAQYNQVIANVQKKYNVTSLDQLTDSKFDGLKSLATTKGGADWVSKARQVLSDFASSGSSSSTPKDTITLSPEAQSQTTQTNLQNNSDALGGSDIALQLLNNTSATTVQGSTQKATHGNASTGSQKVLSKTYEPGDVLNQTT
ncbi:MAG: hypothetical protein ACTHLA_00900 [Asticcacaulis sp.]|uniref:hypothetical protein n=1 Tax=Asticcacaulis sp. TaxID=1872648 RepID=UPI003F7BBB96